MLTCLVLCHFVTVVWLHADPAPHNDWLPVIIPGVGVVVLALIGMAVYYYTRNGIQHRPITKGEIPMDKLPAILLIIGSIAFLIAAFMPITTVFVIERDIARFQSRPVEWAVSLLLFGLGSTLTAVGLGLLTLQLRGPNTATHRALSAAAALGGITNTERTTGQCQSCNPTNRALAYRRSK